MRRCSKITGLHPITIQRKFIYISQKAKLKQSQLLSRFENNKIKHIQFDDLITIEHTKLKPLSVSAAVDAKTRSILSVQVSKIPAFGHLASLSRKKYGKRVNEHRKGLEAMFKELTPIVDPKSYIQSDEHKAYPQFVKEYFPYAKYDRYKGGRGCVTGQGELKKQHFDPLFSINHCFAMMRANINRLFRRSWCTTKKTQMLLRHLHIYIFYHNTVLLN